MVSKIDSRLIFIDKTSENCHTCKINPLYGISLTNSVNKEDGPEVTSIRGTRLAKTITITDYTLAIALNKELTLSDNIMSYYFTSKEQRYKWQSLQ